MHPGNRILNVPYVWERLRKTPLIRPYQRRELRRLEGAKAEIDRRLAEKRRRGEPVNVLFICHRPQQWASLRSVYEALKADPLFRPMIVAIPLRSQVRGLGYLNRRFVSEGAEDFFRPEGCVEGYNYDTGEWLDLRTLKPDYVFFQQPYNIARPDAYTSREVSRYAKICYVTYYVMVDLDSRTEACTPVDFMRDLSFYFSQNEADAEFIRGRLEKAGPNLCRVEITGHPRLEELSAMRPGPCGKWGRQDRWKALWMPRWTTGEGNCHFFSYREALTGWFTEREDTELMLRPHPQAFKEWRKTGEMTEEQEEALRREFGTERMHLDEDGDFYPQLFSADVLISDPSSMIIDSYFTGKPIIYCASGGVNDSTVETLRPGMYWVNSAEELISALEMLRAGEDPLREIRRECAAKYQGSVRIPPARAILEILKADALKGEGQTRAAGPEGEEENHAH